MSTTTTTSWLVDFQNVIKAGDDAYARAAKILVEQLDRDRTATLRLIGKTIQPGLLTYLEQLGRGQLDPRLLAGGGFSSTITRCLSKEPLQVQRKAIDKGLPVVVPERPDEVVDIPVFDMNQQQLHQALFREGARSPEAQRKYLAERKAAAVARQAKTPPAVERVRSSVTIDNKQRLVVTGSVVLTRAQLLDYLRDMGVTVGELAALLGVISQGK